MDESFAGGTNGIVRGFALQPDGKVVAFTESFPSGVVSVLLRFNANGTLDTNFVSHTFQVSLGAVALQADGKVLLSGDFSSISGQTRHGLARFETNGVLDLSFNPGFVNRISTFAVQPDGAILVGGNFTTVGGQPRNRIARLHSDGTLDSSFNPGTDSSVFGLALHADGRIVLGGYFGQVAGQSRRRLARLYSDGALDPTFDLGADTYVSPVLIQSDGKVVAGGSFSSGFFPNQRKNLARLREATTAFQRLTLGANDSSVVWTRTGSSPEVMFVTFEQSADGINYLPVGPVIRGSNSWQVAGLTLPVGQNFYIRARGSCIAGENSSGGGVTESVAQFWRLPPPFLSNVQMLGEAGQFQFSFTNTNATAFSVLASTNAAAPLAQWESLGAPVSVGGGTYQFTDPGATNHARRFYQLRSP